MTASELGEWAAFARNEPFGAARGDYQAAVVASVMVNLQIPKDGPKVSAVDFLPDFYRRLETEPPPAGVVNFDEQVLALFAPLIKKD